jgi:hypothetical protein
MRWVNLVGILTDGPDVDIALRRVRPRSGLRSRAPAILRVAKGCAHPHPAKRTGAAKALKRPSVTINGPYVKSVIIEDTENECPGAKGLTTPVRETSKVPESNSKQSQIG